MASPNAALQASTALDPQPIRVVEIDPGMVRTDEFALNRFDGDAQRAASVYAGVAEPLVAEDIAEFPDLNLAESLQRIPGVAITRANGEGAQITVRGLPGLYTRVRINGMEARGNTQVVRAHVPLSEMFGYSTDLRSRTQGRATYTMQFHSYQQVPKAIADEIVARVRGE